MDRSLGIWSLKMLSGLQWSSVFWLLVVGSTYIGAAARAAAAVQPARESAFVLSADNYEDQHFTLSPVGTVHGADPSATVSSPDSIGPATTQPAAINDPLPPAFWPGLCMLALAGTLLSVRRLRRQLR
jgi:hypothetical protein